jgi:hypothetical protein
MARVGVEPVASNAIVPVPHDAGDDFDLGETDLSSHPWKALSIVDPRNARANVHQAALDLVNRGMPENRCPYNGCSLDVGHLADHTYACEARQPRWKGHARCPICAEFVFQPEITSCTSEDLLAREGHYRNCYRTMLTLLIERVRLLKTYGL